MEDYPLNLSRVGLTESADVSIAVMSIGGDRLRALTSLTLCENSIVELPEDFFTSLTGLRELDVSHNFLTNLPIRLNCDRPHKLETFRGDHNRFHRIPPGLIQPCTVHVSLANNRIAVLNSEALEAADQLEFLNLNDNVICDLPREALLLPKLRSLGIFSNVIERLPQAASQVQSLDVEWWRYLGPQPPKRSANDLWRVLAKRPLGFVDFVRLFDPNPAFEALLGTAVAHGHLAVVKALISHGVSPDYRQAKSPRPLLLAIQKQHPEVARFLIESGADVGICSGPFGSCLHLAVVNMDLATVKLLLEAGAPVDVDEDGNTPLHVLFSIFNKGAQISLQLAEALISANCDVNQQNDNWWSPIHLAVRRGQVHAVLYVLHKRSEAAEGCLAGSCIHAIEGRCPKTFSIDITGGHNAWTPLHLAAHLGHMMLVHLLLEGGADVLLRSLQGQLPHQMCGNHGPLALVLHKHERRRRVAAVSRRGRPGWFVKRELPVLFSAAAPLPVKPAISPRKPLSPLETARPTSTGETSFDDILCEFSVEPPKEMSPRTPAGLRIGERGTLQHCLLSQVRQPLNLLHVAYRSAYFAFYRLTRTVHCPPSLELGILCSPHKSAVGDMFRSASRVADNSILDLFSYILESRSVNSIKESPQEERLVMKSTEWRAIGAMVSSPYGLYFAHGKTPTLIIDPTGRLLSHDGLRPRAILRMLRMEDTLSQLYHSRREDMRIHADALLVLCAKHSSLTGLQMLLQMGADPQATDGGRSALLYASEASFHAGVYLLSSLSDVYGARDPAPLLAAWKQRDLWCVGRLVNCGHSVPYRLSQSGGRLHPEWAQLLDAPEGDTGLWLSRLMQLHGVCSEVDRSLLIQAGPHSAFLQPSAAQPSGSCRPSSYMWEIPSRLVSKCLHCKTPFTFGGNKLPCKSCSLVVCPACFAEDRCPECFAIERLTSVTW